MGHDYNLPFGPWGMEAEPQMFLDSVYVKSGSTHFLRKLVGSKKSTLEVYLCDLRTIICHV